MYSSSSTTDHSANFQHKLAYNCLCSIKQGCATSMVSINFNLVYVLPIHKWVHCYGLTTSHERSFQVVGIFYREKYYASEVVKCFTMSFNPLLFFYHSVYNRGGHMHWLWWTHSFYKLNPYTLQVEPFHFTSWTHSFHKLNPFILQVEPIHLSSWTHSFYKFTSIPRMQHTWNFYWYIEIHESQQLMMMSSIQCCKKFLCHNMNASSWVILIFRT